MKKYTKAYLVLFLILLGLQLTKGIPVGIPFITVGNKGIIDGGMKKYILLVFNIVIMIVCFVAAVVFTRQKDNPIKMKWVFPVLMFVYFFFMPIFMIQETGGLYNRNIQVFLSFVTSFWKWY